MSVEITDGGKMCTGQFSWSIMEGKHTIKQEVTRDFTKQDEIFVFQMDTA